MKFIKYWFYYSILSIALWAFFDIKLWIESPFRELALVIYYILGLCSGIFVISAVKHINASGHSS